MDILRIKFIIPKHYSIEIDANPKLTLILKNQVLKLSIKSEETPMYRSYTLESEPLTFKIDQDLITKIKDTMYLITLDLDKGILINPELKTFHLGPDFQKQLSEQYGVPVLADSIGVQIVQQGTKFVSSSATASVKSKIDIFENLLNKYVDLNYRRDEKIFVALELYNSTNYLNIINQSSRFILYMSAIECLIDQSDISKEAQLILKDTESEIQNSNIDSSEKVSLLGSLNFLKKESIKRAGNKMIEKLFNPNDTYSRLNPIDFFNKAYDLRSRFVHSGKTKTNHLDIKNNELQRFTKDLITNYFNKICC